MSVLTKGMAMDFVREGRKEMAITSIWPASVRPQQQFWLKGTDPREVDRVSRHREDNNSRSRHQKRPKEAGRLF